MNNYKSLLLYPPSADFTQPYPAIPYLSAFLKSKGENVIIKDINAEAHNYILKSSFLKNCYSIVEKRFSDLNRKNSLNILEQREYLTCINALGINQSALNDINSIKQSFNSKKLFFNYDSYTKNINLLKQSFDLISAAYYPVKIEPGEYTTPFFLSTDDDIIQQTDINNNPFLKYYKNVLISYIRNEKPNFIGLSVVYASQILQMFAITDLIKKIFPNIHICVGGSFICRLALNLPNQKFQTIFKYIDSIILYEGETALYNLISHLKNSSNQTADLLNLSKTESVSQTQYTADSSNSPQTESVSQTQYTADSSNSPQTESVSQTQLPTDLSNLPKSETSPINSNIFDASSKNTSNAKLKSCVGSNQTPSEKKHEVSNVSPQMSLDLKIKNSSLLNTILFDNQNKIPVFSNVNPYYENLDLLPPPDYDGYNMNLYLSPELFLPYSPTRGCFWNNCAFCHYGSTKSGTAKYREKSIDRIIADLDILSSKYKTNNFSFSVDVISSKTMLAIADILIQKKKSYFWNADVRFDEYYSIENCLKLKKSGCMSVAIGLESASNRILKLMNKGITAKLAQNCIMNFSKAGIAAQVMTFLHFPTESENEALQTVNFIKDNYQNISLFTMCDFELLSGSKIFQNPNSYGIKKIYSPPLNEFNILIYYDEENNKSESQKQNIENEYLNIAGLFAENDFSFAGAVSTNHTLLYFKNFDKNIFKELALNLRKEEEEKNKVLKLNDIPLINSKSKIIDANFNIKNIEDNISDNTVMINYSDKNFSKRQLLDNQIKNSKIETPLKTSYILIDDMKWLDLPQLLLNILRYCNGKNNVDDILNRFPSEYTESLYTALNYFYNCRVITCS